MLGDAHTPTPQPRRKPLHVTRRLQHQRAWREKAGPVVAAAGQIRHRLRVKHLSGFPQCGQMRSVTAVVGLSRSACRAVHFAHRIGESGVNLVLRHGRLSECDGLTVERDERAIITCTRIIVRGQIMRQIDHETGVTASSAFANAQSVEDDNIKRGVKLDQPLRGGKTGKAAANDDNIRDLRVIGRTSTFVYKGRSANLTEIREALGAGYAVEGSVRRSAGRVRISCQLIDASTGVHLWAEHFDREMEEIFAVQDEVTRMIAVTLGVKVQEAALQRALKKNPAELDAYDCVLRARPYTTTLSSEMHSEARDLLETAIERDPSNADAHALLANVYLAEHRFDANPRPDSIARALQMAEKAVRLDPQNAYAHCWLAIVHFFQGENDKFRAEARRALALNPNDPETLADIGHFYAFMGEFEHGLELSLRAQELNPLHPGWYHFSAVRFHYDVGNYEETLADLQKVGMSDFYWTHLFAAAALGQLGRIDEAAVSLGTMLALKPDCSPRKELQKWNAAPEDLEHLMEGLSKAGLKES